MAKLVFVCGAPSGPTAGVPVFYSPFLSTCIVNSLVVNNVPMNCIYPTPDLNHYPNQQLLVNNKGNWAVNDKIEIDFTPLYQLQKTYEVTT